MTGYQRVAWTHNRDIYSVTKRQGQESSLDFALFHLIYIEFFIFGNQHLVWPDCPEGLVGEGFLLSQKRACPIGPRQL